MAKQELNKLVRDRVPDLIRAEGKRPVTSQLEGLNLRTHLTQKLQEEVGELSVASCDLQGGQAKVREELADIVEVAHTIAKSWGLTFHDVVVEVMKKRDEKGGFEKGLFIHHILDDVE